jgi:hypothetical protein
VPTTFNGATFNGDVGIGTTSPDTILHLYRNATGSHYQRIQNVENNGGCGIELMRGNTTTWGSTAYSDWRINNSGHLDFGVKFTGTDKTVLHLDTTGNVGIGTTGPSQKLHLHNDDEYVYYRMSTTAGGVTDNFDIAQWNSTRSSGDHGIFLNNRANTTMAFNTNDTERMRIHNGTTVAVAGGTAGKGVAFAHAGIAIDRVWGNYPSITVMNENSGSETNQGQLRIHGCNVSYNSYPNSSGSDFGCSVYIDGTYQTGSDRRFKTNITTIDNALEKVLSITGKRYQLLNYDGNIRTNVSTNDYKYGFIAQEIQDAGFEETYIHYTDEDDGTDGYNKAYSLDYNCFIPLLVNAVKEQQQIIETMRTEIENIKNSA